MSASRRVDDDVEVLGEVGWGIETTSSMVRSSS